MTLFRLRFVHTTVLAASYLKTRRHPDRKPDFSHNEIGTLPNLYDVLIRDLEEKPLVRRSGPINETDETLGDLGWTEELADKSSVES